MATLVFDMALQKISVPKPTDITSKQKKIPITFEAYKIKDNSAKFAD